MQSLLLDARFRIEYGTSFAGMTVSRESPTTIAVVTSKGRGNIVGAGLAPAQGDRKGRPYKSIFVGVSHFFYR